jgi:hypothetical protein
MEIKILKTKKDYLNALARFEEIFQATKESEDADVLALLIKE